MKDIRNLEIGDTLPNGSTFIDWKFSDKNADDDIVVLAKNNRYDYVTWIIPNKEEEVYDFPSNLTVYGHYFTDKIEAYKDFLKR